jgi:hypothetical protein
MSDLMNNQPKVRSALVTAALLAATSSAILVSACAGYATVDGYDAEYVDNAPANVEVYPQYRFADGYVYDVHGRYYHQHEGRWVAYRSAPRGMVRVERR